MAASRSNVFPKASSGQPASFRFPITWSCLAEPLGSVKIEEKLVLQSAPVALIPTVLLNEPSSSSVVATGPAALEFVATPRPDDSWEMVIPKMGRPGAGTSRMPLTQPSASLKPANSITPTASHPPMVEIPKKESGTDLGLLTMGGFPGE